MYKIISKEDKLCIRNNGAKNMEKGFWPLLAGLVIAVFIWTLSFDDNTFGIVLFAIIGGLFVIRGLSFYYKILAGENIMKFDNAKEKAVLLLNGKQREYYYSQVKSIRLKKLIDKRIVVKFYENYEAGDIIINIDGKEHHILRSEADNSQDIVETIAKFLDIPVYKEDSTSRDDKKSVRIEGNLPHS